MLRRARKKQILGEAVAEKAVPGRVSDVLTDEQVVFGGADDVVERLEERFSAKKRRRTKELETESKPAWIDEDDTDLKVKIAARDVRHADVQHLDGKEITSAQYASAITHQYEKVMGAQPSWAKLGRSRRPSDEDTDSDSDDLLRSTGNYLAASACLPAGVVQLQKCSDLNRDRATQGKIRSVEFHPNAQVALTAGMDSTLALFQVDGKHNPKIQSIYVKGFPIYTAHFSPDGNEVVFGSNSKQLYSYDLIEGRVMSTVITADGYKNSARFSVSPDGRYIAVLGRDGYINIISARSKEWIDSVKMNGAVEAVAFNNDGSRMFSHGTGGDVHVWDMNTRSCIHRFTDDGCTLGTSLAVSNGNKFIAAGSDSGVVNVYDCAAALSSAKPAPLKALNHLVTSSSTLRFNSTAEILAIASNAMEHAVKLVHVPSMTVFSNFPAFRERLRFPYSLDFSLHSGYFALGNNQGQALLYRVKHYSDY